MSDITVIDEPTDPPKRRAGRPRGSAKRRAARKPVAAAGSPLEGLDALSCASGCRPDRCVISGAGICAHPAKGGLQANLQNEKTLRMFNEARKIIAGLKLKIGE